MDKFNFLIGSWSLKYTVPKSTFSDKATGNGKGIFKKAFNNKYVYFDYKAKLTTGSTKAHAIFAKDIAQNVYKFWWFEDSGNFSTATCNFIDENTLFLNWHDTLLIQTFEKINEDNIILKMSHPISQQMFEPILIVEFSKK